MAAPGGERLSERRLSGDELETTDVTDGSTSALRLARQRARQQLEYGIGHDARQRQQHGPAEETRPRGEDDERADEAAGHLRPAPARDALVQYRGREQRHPRAKPFGPSSARR